MNNIVKEHFEVELPEGIALFDKYCSEARFIQENCKILKILSLKSVKGDIGDIYHPNNYEVQQVDSKSIVVHEHLIKTVYMYKVFYKGKKVSTRESNTPLTDREIIINHIAYMDDLPL